MAITTKSIISHTKSLILVFIISLLFIAGNYSNAETIIVPDQYQTIQSAIDTANSGDTVLVRAGSYHEFLVMKDSIAVVAEGVDDGNWNRALRTKIHSDGLRDNEGKVPPVVNCADGSVIDGFEITGMDTVNHHLPGHSHAVQNRGKSGTITNCLIHDNGSTGIGSHVMDGNPAIPTIIGNKVYRNYGIGIGFNRFSKGIASGNIVYENRETGIGCQNGSSPLLERNIVFENGWNGISARKGAYPAVILNKVYSNGNDLTGDEMPPGAGIGISADSSGWFAPDGEQPLPMFISENEVYNNPSGGIMARNNARVSITGNSCYDNTANLIGINGCRDVVVSGNDLYISMISTFQGRGIVITNNSSAVISDNQINNVLNAGIIISEGSTADITNNHIEASQQAGVRIEGSGSIATISRNLAINNNAMGISAVSGSVEIHHNLLIDNINGGISVDENASGEIYNNTIIADENASGRGIYATTNATPVVNNIVVGYSVGIFKSGDPAIDYNLTHANGRPYNGPPGSGGDNAVSGDPMFANPEEGDFHLMQNSPCIDKGDPDAKYNDPDGSRSDIGSFPYEKPNSVNSSEESQAVLTVYPAVTNGIVNIEIRDESLRSSNHRAGIYSITGVKIAEIRIESGIGIWDSGSWQPGVYFIVVSIGNERYGSRIIRIK